LNQKYLDFIIIYMMKTTLQQPNNLFPPVTSPAPHAKKNFRSSESSMSSKELVKQKYIDFIIIYMMKTAE